jgi:8-oxo-dGTP pyrophosphatase MutT (NUDIX family)
VARSIGGVLRDFPIPGTPVEQGEPAVPRNAATVILVRDGTSGVEVFLLRRLAAMAFAAGMHVFPGGGVDERDDEPGLGWVGPQPAELAPLLSADAALSRAIVVAAARETFEECGVLLGGRDGSDVVTDLDDESWEQDRLALVAGRIGLAGVLGRRGLRLRADLLLPWAHWITPVYEPRRYDTRFFLAALPAGQCPRQVAGEADRSGWLPAAAAIEQYRAGQVALLPPTLVCLEEIAAAGSLAELLGTRRRPRPVMPWLVPDGGGVRVDLDGAGGGEPAP